MVSKKSKAPKLVSSSNIWSQVCKVLKVVMPGNLPFWQIHRQLLYQEKDQNLDSFYPNITFTAEEDPKQFTDISCESTKAKFTIHHKSQQKTGKLQVHRKSAISERWKHITSLGAHYTMQNNLPPAGRSQSDQTIFFKAKYPVKIIMKSFKTLKTQRVTKRSFQFSGSVTQLR